MNNKEQKIALLQKDIERLRKDSMYHEDQIGRNSALIYEMNKQINDLSK